MANTVSTLVELKYILEELRLLFSLQDYYDCFPN
jgi:hypothetical protein